MLHDLYSVGYLNPGALDLLQERVNQGAIIVDIRQVAGSRYRPVYSGKRLRERFGARYQRIRELGNEHYNQPGAPILLRDSQRGIAQLLALLEQRDACLLCRCKRLAICHTTVVLKEALRVCPAIRFFRIGEEGSR
jgi:hypothetical protein